MLMVAVNLKRGLPLAIIEAYTTPHLNLESNKSKRFRIWHSSRSEKEKHELHIIYCTTFSHCVSEFFFFGRYPSPPPLRKKKEKQMSAYYFHPPYTKPKVPFGVTLATFPLYCIEISLKLNFVRPTPPRSTSHPS